MPSLVELSCWTILGIRGGRPDLMGDTSIGSFVGGNALGSPVGCFGGLFSSKFESELLLLPSSISGLFAESAVSPLFSFCYKRKYFE